MINTACSHNNTQLTRVLIGLPAGRTESWWSDGGILDAEVAVQVASNRTFLSLGQSGGSHTCAIATRQARLGQAKWIAACCCVAVGLTFAEAAYWHEFNFGRTSCFAKAPEFASCPLLAFHSRQPRHLFVLEQLPAALLQL